MDPQHGGMMHMHMHGQCSTDQYQYRLQVLERRIDMLERMLLIQHQANDMVLQLSSLHRGAAVGHSFGMGFGGSAPAPPAPAGNHQHQENEVWNAGDAAAAAPHVQRRAVS